MAADIKEFREILRRRKAELSAGADSSKDSRRPVERDPAAVGRVSRIDAIQQHLADARRREQQLQQIEAAFKRLGDGGFGYCIKCDEEIAQKRPALNPAIMTCIA